jgi:hypothetical protein
MSLVHSGASASIPGETEAASLFAIPTSKKAEPHQNGADTSDIWLTPPSIIEALGGSDSFDLDPATPDVMPWATAKARYTIADNGLTSPWAGRIWLNPPYSRPAYSRFMGRMAAHNHGTALIFARTETRDFFDTVWSRASALLFLKGRLSFLRPDGRPSNGNSGAPSVLCAYGEADAQILRGCGLEGAFVDLRLQAAA